MAGRGEGSGVKVLVVDDQRVVREGLATVIDHLAGVEVVGLAADGGEALTLVEAHHPDVVLMDLRMPKMGGAEATGLIRRSHPGTHVVILTTFADDESIIEALSAGAIGFLTKDATREDIHRALDAAAAGQSMLDPEVQAKLVQAASQGADRSGPKRAEPLPDGLTEREAEVLLLIARGESNSEIAGELFVAEATIKTHVNHIFAKTGSRDRAQAAAYAHRNGLAG